MKKRLYLLLILVIALSACSPQPQQQPQNPPRTGAESEIYYSEEIPYLPEHPNIVLEDFQEADEQGQFNQANYIIEGVEFENFLAEYEQVLLSEGWEVIQDEKPNTLSMQREERIAVFIVHKLEGNLVVTVLSK